MKTDISRIKPIRFSHIRLRMSSVIFLLVIFIGFRTNFVYANNHASIDEDLATPEKTVLSYCKNGVFDLRLKYFHFPKERTRDSTKSILGWNNCTILSVRGTELAGRVSDGSLVKPTDIEVILKVKEPSMTDKYITSEYWFLESQFDTGWKIISYALISDDTID